MTKLFTYFPLASRFFGNADILHLTGYLPLTIARFDIGAFHHFRPIFWHTVEEKQETYPITMLMSANHTFFGNMDAFFS
jgi:hypothetical protein